MCDNYNIDDVMPGKQKGKRKDLLNQLKEIEDDSYVSDTGYSSYSFLPSSMLKPQDEIFNDKKKKKKNTDEYTDDDADKWFGDLLALSNVTVNKKGKIRNELFESAGITGKKKKKKKKDKENDLIDYKKELEPEMALYRNLLMEQNRFTDSLQKEYDSIKSVKASSRGVTKQMTDLIANITSARSLAMQLVEKNVSAKKLIAELTLKQRKEMGLNNGEGENMADFASNYLKQMLNDRQTIMNGTGELSVSEYTEDELFEELSNSVMNDSSFNRPEEVDRYLKYENRNITVYVVITDDDVENYEFLAKDEEGYVIDDYPMPNHTSISVNRSTNIATDTYGKKYSIIWR